MQNFSKPLLVFSRCLGFCACRYNGAIIEDEFCQRLRAHVECITPCPEAEIGLGVPRDPIRIVTTPDGARLLVQPATGRDCTAPMREYCANFAAGLPEVDGFVLKSKSPSCGRGTVKSYPDAQSKISLSGKTDGFFAHEMKERFPLLPFEDEGRLNNFLIRERFLTRAFTLAAFRRARSTGSFNDLLHFHTVNKELLRLYSQGAKIRMGQLLAAHKEGDEAGLFAQYQQLLLEALAAHPRQQALANFFEHGLGAFKHELNAADKQFFIESMRDWRQGRLPASAIIRMLRGWAVHFENTWLLEQTILQPFPPDLVDIHDSGKGRDV